MKKQENFKNRKNKMGMNNEYWKPGSFLKAITTKNIKK